MSKSKEGVDKREDAESDRRAEQPSEIDQRLGAMGQTDYTSGRESSREFPRRSTARRIPINDARNRDWESPRDYERYSERDYQRGRQLSRQDQERSSFRGGDRGFSQTRDVDPNDRYGNRYDRSDYEDRGRHRAGQASHREQQNESRSGYESAQGLRGSEPGSRARYGRELDREYDYNYDRPDSERSSYREEPRWRHDAYGEYFEPSIGGSPSYYERPEGRRVFWRRDESRRQPRRLRCADIMTKNVTVIAPRAFLREAADKMDDEDVGSLPVAENGRLLGIITDRDIVCRAVALGKSTRATPVSETMSQDIITCSPDDSVLDAIQKMAEHQIRRIPICDTNGRIRGMLSIADIALEAETDRDLADALEQISRPTPDRSRRV
jgi:CBS domain-containing protein